MTFNTLFYDLLNPNKLKIIKLESKSYKTDNLGLVRPF